jgi:antitoxin component of RelBE/YafQ-DinJ toxin-antitoxin module
MAELHIKIDETLKNDAIALFEKYGTNIDDVPMMTKAELDEAINSEEIPAEEFWKRFKDKHGY